jgi:hypothetical protein
MYFSLTCWPWIGFRRRMFVWLFSVSFAFGRTGQCFDQLKDSISCYMTLKQENVHSISLYAKQPNSFTCSERYELCYVKWFDELGVFGLRRLVLFSQFKTNWQTSVFSIEIIPIYTEICFFLLFSFCNLHAKSLFILLEQISYDGTFIWSICRSVCVWCWEGKYLFCWHFRVSLSGFTLFVF